jgi:hypothetical protein
MIVTKDQEDLIIQKAQDLWCELEAIQVLYATKKICTYRPIGQQPKFHAEDDATIRLVLGSNRSGKTVAGVVEAIAHSLGYRPWLDEDHPDRIVRLANGEPIPVPNDGRIIAQDYQQAINQTIVPKIQEWAPAGWYTFKRDNRGIPIEVRWKNGSRTYLLSNDQKDMSFEGTSGHWVWGDEPFDYAKYTGLRRGLVDFSGHMWITMTPLSQPWMHDVIYSRANTPNKNGYIAVRLYKFSIWDNCIENGGYLRREDIEEFLSDLDEAELEARLYGNFLHLAGRVFKEWEPEPPYWIEPFKIPEKWPRVCVIDPHPRKPVAVLWAAIDPHNRVIVYRDLFDRRLTTIKDVANRIKELEGWKWSDLGNKYAKVPETENIACRVIDDSSKQPDRITGDTVFNRFATEGIGCSLANKKNAEAGYDAIKAALKMRNEWDQPGLVVFNNCKTVKQNFLNFVWDEWATSKQRETKEQKQEVRKNNDDMIDDIRYIYQNRLNNFHLLRHADKKQSYDRDETWNGKNMMSGLQGPLTRRERQARRWRTSQQRNYLQD